jgi:very-short-patch-repair endonuclease
MTTQQLEIDGTITSGAVARAVKRKQKRSKGHEAEGDFGFHVRAHKLPVIMRKLRFAESLGRRWEADYAYPEHMLLIEIDGGVWRRGGGAHSHPTNILRDMEKQNDAVLLGYQVLRFTTDQVRKGDAIEFLMRVLHARGWRR